MANNGMNIIVDCDAGIDDVLALFLLFNAHKHERLRIEAVTCVYGNTSVKNVVKNVFRVLELFKGLGIPVYRGAYTPLMEASGHPESKDHCYHGVKVSPNPISEPDCSNVRIAHAAYAMNKYTSEHPGQISIVCLGPLTNVALTIKLYQDFVCNMKNLYIMGGNSTGQGNITSHAEFNFFCDPESASIVLTSIRLPIFLLPWETCLKSCITHHWRKEVLGTIKTPFVEMLNRMEEGALRNRKGEQTKSYVMCDAILAGIIVRPEMATSISRVCADVELHGSKTRGQVVFDRESEIRNVHMINDFDSEILKELLLFAVNPLKKKKSVLHSSVSANKIILNKNGVHGLND